MTTTTTMTHDEYTTAVNEGRWPADPRVPLPEAFHNDAGMIQNLLLKPCQSVAAIASKLGTVRANHYHKTDWHYTFVAAGSLLYFEREVGSLEVPEPKYFSPGTLFFTPPMREHAMLFTTPSLIVTLARNVRSHESHEDDVVRVDFVSAEVAKRYGFAT